MAPDVFVVLAFDGWFESSKAVNPAVWLRYFMPCFVLVARLAVLRCWLVLLRILTAPPPSREAYLADWFGLLCLGVFLFCGLNAKAPGAFLLWGLLYGVEKVGVFVRLGGDLLSRALLRAVPEGPSCQRHDGR
jgi:hypothetical protein